MSHKGIRLLIEDVSKSLGNDIQFTYARTSDFNQTPKQRYPFIVLDLLTASPQYAVNNVSNYMKTWTCNMAFYLMDDMDSTQEQYTPLLDQTDELVDTFINKLNAYAFSQRVNSDMFVITGITQTPFIKTTSQVLTGHLLTFQLQVNDQFNYCGLDC
jgi:hypothetical protein